MKRKEIQTMERMKVRKVFPIILLSILFMAFILSLPFEVNALDVNSTDKGKTVPEFLDINTQQSCKEMKGLKKDIKSVYRFSHKAHIQMLKGEEKDFVCVQCHCGAKTKSDILNSEKCKRLEKELAETGGPSRLKNHYHDICLKCHKGLKKQGKSTGPTSCKGCHKRKGEKK